MKSEVTNSHLWLPRGRISLTLVFVIVLCLLLVITQRSPLFFVHISPVSFQDAKCVIPNENHKFDCFPRGNVTRELCEARGCCWVPRNDKVDKVPWCYFPQNYRSYYNVNVSRFETGLLAYWSCDFHSPYPKDVQMLLFHAEYQTEYRLHIKLEDASKSRYEAIYPIIDDSMKLKNNRERNYVVELAKDESGFIIKRSNGNVLYEWAIKFDAKGIGGFMFADQYLQLSAHFEGEIYGLGEHQSILAIDRNWTSFTLWNSDIVPLENTNLYGSHPFYIVVEPDGSAHGVFLRNSNAMDIIIQPLPAITFRAIGGIFDFYFFTGPTPADVIAQYTELIGRPAMPPYWALGFHLCRLGYKNVSHMEIILNRNLEAGIPVDTQWVDMDYMKNRNDFTLDNVSFAHLPEFVNELHKQGIHFVPMLDPGISAGEPSDTYPPFDEAVRTGVLVKNQDGSPFIGKVWNRNKTAFPDFTNNATDHYWNKYLRLLHRLIPFDGLWIDMNEPSNFVDGSLGDGCPDNNLENPPYMPSTFGAKLYRKTICMSAVHSAGSHYDLHNLYGISEAHLTFKALVDILETRPFIISRSTFPGVGQYAGHWSGDVASTWHDMKRSISQMLSFSLYGVPMMGSDVCGFNGNTTEHLCMRWSQLGAFYPFSRNHNTDDALDQDPAALGLNVIKSAKNALMVRYTLLPYLYTLFWRAHTAGETVARPLFFEFPWDSNTYKVDESFLWGCCVLIVPVLEDQMTTVMTYLPAGRWYDSYTLMATETTGENVTLNAPSDTIPVLIRGGAILVTQTPAPNTFLSRGNQMSLLAAASIDRTAAGALYWDDGVSIDVTKAHGLVDFTLNAANLTSHVRVWSIDEVPVLGTIRILGFFQVINKVYIDDKSWPYSWNSTSLVLTITNLNIPINQQFTVVWT